MDHHSNIKGLITQPANLSSPIFILKKKRKLKEFYTDLKKKKK